MPSNKTRQQELTMNVLESFARFLIDVAELVNEHFGDFIVYLKVWRSGYFTCIEYRRLHRATRDCFRAFQVIIDKYIMTYIDSTDLRDVVYSIASQYFEDVRKVFSKSVDIHINESDVMEIVNFVKSLAFSLPRECTLIEHCVRRNCPYLREDTDKAYYEKVTSPHAFMSALSVTTFRITNILFARAKALMELL